MSVQLTLPAEYSDKKFVICAKKINGFGDLICGLRVARVLRDIGVLPSNILIATNNTAELSFLAKNEFEIIDLKTVTQVKNVALQIFAPHGEQSHIDEFIDGAPILLIKEYGYQQFQDSLGIRLNITQKSMGLEPEYEEIGILIDEPLYAWSKSKESQDPQERAEKLQLLSEPLRKAIFGNNENTQTFAEKTLVYHGYAREHDCLHEFIAAICTLNTENQKDIIIVLPIPALVEGDIFEQVLERKNISCLIFYNLDTQRETEYPIQEEGNTLKIIYGHVTHKDITYLHMGTEKEMIVTGDQSLTEAISCGASFVYEEHDHKKNLSLSISRLYGDVIVKRGDDMTATMIGTFVRNKGDSYQTLQNKHGQIYQNHNCKHAIIGLVQESLNNPNRVQLTPTFQHPSITTDNFPFDKQMMVTAAQINALQINENTRKSKYQEFSDSIFDWSYMSDGFYTLIRRKRLP